MKPRRSQPKGVGVASGDASFDGPAETRSNLARSAALGRMAARTVAGHSAGDVLQAMASEMQETEGIAGTQIMTTVPGGSRLQVMGSAGFSEVATFFDRLNACDQRGARLVTTQAMRTREQVVFRDRRRAMLADDRWEPLHDYITQLEWDDFIATPLIVGEEAIGVLNIYVEPGVEVGESLLGFLTAMSVQAALAVDYARLIQRDRVAVRTAERRRLAHELHDSVVQHVFSIGMQASGITALTHGSSDHKVQRVGEMAEEIVQLSQAVQRDLRGVVLALQPSAAAEHGLDVALRSMTEGVERRSGIRIHAAVDGPQGPVELVEDLFQIATEAVHNAVKHAQPSSISLTIAGGESDTVRVEVVDDGIGLAAARTRGGFGLTSMRDRAARWGGTVTLEQSTVRGGTRLAATMHHPDQAEVTDQ